MNCLCSEARAYLKSSNINENEIKTFIDKYNNELNKYTKNGLSSYILECVEVAIKLTRLVNYKEGEIFSRIIRGDVLSNGGHYKLALKSYEFAYNKLSDDDLNYKNILVKLVFSYLIIGDNKRVTELLDFMKSDYKDVYDECDIFVSQYIVKKSDDDRSPGIDFHKVDSIEKYLTLSGLYKNYIKDIQNSELILKELMTFLNDTNCTVSAHIESLKCLSLRQDNIATRINSIFNNFDKKEFFILYIDGLLNIVETFIQFNLPDNAFKLLNIVIDEKREVKLFDSRINELKIRCQAVLAI